MKAHQKTSLFAIACFVLSTAGASAGCHRSSPVKAAEASPQASVAKLSKIVFVGKEHACECTRKTVDASWAMLQKVLGGQSAIPVERMQVDTAPARVEPYRKQRPIMALPAIYFVDAKGAVLEVLQGEVSEAQIQPVLERTR